MKISFFILTFFFMILYPVYSQTQHINIENNKIDDQNLFDYNIFPDSSLFERIDSEISYFQKYPIKLKANKPFNQSFIFILCVFLIFIVILIRIINPEYLTDIFQGLFNSELLIDNYQRKGKRILLLINNLILEIVFITSFSMLIYFLILPEIFSSLAITIFFVSICYVIQVLLVSIFYRVFFGTQTNNLHLLNILNYNRMIGLILTPLIFLTLFSDPPLNLILLGTIKLMLIIIIAYRLLRNFLIIKRFNAANFFYILLYLCVFEITIYLVILKESGVFK